MSSRITALVVALAAAALVLALPASAAQTQVSGEQTYVSGNRSAMSGGLVGDWFTDSIACTEVPGAIGVTWPCRGTEHFDGCLNTNGDEDCDLGEPSGQLYFTFTYTGTPVGNGRCHHPIVGGSGDFAGATGQLTFKDRVGPCGTLVTTYKGHIDLP
jgi:hypothetical protein